MTSSGELVLLDFWVSPFCMRVKIALGEKGGEYEAIDEDLFGGKSDLLLKSNPIYQKVPVLLHNGKPLCESTLILGYIDETWPSPPLLPSCAYERAQARFWADYIDKKLFDTVCGIWRGKGDAKKELIGMLKVLEGGLGEKDFFGGDSFGFVDIVAIPLTCWFSTVESLGELNVENECPRISGWIKRCMQRESVSKAIPHPEKVAEFALNMTNNQAD